VSIERDRRREPNQQHQAHDSTSTSTENLSEGGGPPDGVVLSAGSAADGVSHRLGNDVSHRGITLNPRRGVARARMRQIHDIGHARPFPTGLFRPDRVPWRCVRAAGASRWLAQTPSGSSVG
jgi:hypothetical protein